MPVSVPKSTFMLNTVMIPLHGAFNSHVFVQQRFHKLGYSWFSLSCDFGFVFLLVVLGALLVIFAYLLNTSDKKITYLEKMPSVPGNLSKASGHLRKSSEDFETP